MDVVIEDCIEDRYSDIEKKVDVVIEDCIEDWYSDRNREGWNGRSRGRKSVTLVLYPRLTYL